jgi:hypothetical protein
MTDPMRGAPGRVAAAERRARLETWYRQQREAGRSVNQIAKLGSVAARTVSADLRALRLMPPRTKRCPGCRQDLPLSRFAPQPSGARNGDRTCRDCQRSETATTAAQRCAPWVLACCGGRLTGSSPGEWWHADHDPGCRNQWQLRDPLAPEPNGRACSAQPGPGPASGDLGRPGLGPDTQQANADPAGATMTSTPLVAVYASCLDCAHHIGNPPEYAPGRHMVIGHAAHIAELEPLGWVVTYTDPDDPDVPDVACPHYHAAHYRTG